jgi:hypothetical protein
MVKNYQHRAASRHFFGAVAGELEEGEAPTSTTFSHVNYAPAATITHRTVAQNWWRGGSVLAKPKPPRYQWPILY